MSKSTINITGTLMTVAVDMHLKAGMRVVVVNGVILSIYSGDTTVPLATAQPRVKDTAPPKPRRVHGNRPSSVRADGTPISSVNPYVQYIREQLRTQESITRGSIYGNITTVDGEPTGWRVSAAIKYLVGRGEVTMEGRGKRALIRRVGNASATT